MSPQVTTPRTFLHYVFDQAKADRAVRFIETCLYFSKGKWSGKQFKLRPWQRTIIETIFGWIDPATNLRRYRKVFIFLPRKNGKSHLAAAIALYMLFGDGEHGAEVILAANSRDQSGICFSAASGMVRQSPILSPACLVIPSTKRILVKDSESYLRAVSAEVPTSLGLDISCLIYDEVAFAPNRELYDALTTSEGSREQPLQVFITTAGWDSEGIGYNLYTYAKTILNDPKSDPTFLPVIFEVPENADWTDEATWSTANPALGEFLQLETLRNELREALNKPSEAGKFRMFHANQWVQAAESWLDIQKWSACAMSAAGVSEETFLKGLPCFIGLDLSATTDITALVALYELPDHKMYVQPFFWLPGDDLREREKLDHVPYSVWQEQNKITLTPGSLVDYSFIKERLKAIADSHEVKAVMFDPWHATQFIQELEKDGYNCVKIRQGHESLAAPTKKLESLIVSKNIIHNDNPVMNWMVQNVVVRLDANANMVPDKKKSRHRIDGVAASIFALGGFLKLENEPKKKAPVTFRVTVL